VCYIKEEIMAKTNLSEIIFNTMYLSKTMLHLGKFKVVIDNITNHIEERQWRYWLNRSRVKWKWKLLLQTV